jgi:hypothetical protein
MIKLKGLVKRFDLLPVTLLFSLLSFKIGVYLSLTTLLALLGGTVAILRFNTKDTPL